MDIWLTITGMAFVTLLTRLAGLLLLGREIPVWLMRWLNHVPVAVFTALIIPELLVRDGSMRPIAAAVPALAAGAVGAGVAWRGGGVVLTIAAGLAAFWALRLLGV
jgi:branched-subunit amino acid transport protein